METDSIVYHSPIGFIQISGSKDYITKVDFHDETPNITPFIETEENVLLKFAFIQIKDYFEKKLKKFTFPILQPGTHFQMAVWNELLEIPYGKTSTYLQLAKNLGDSKKLRAVGNANSRNNIAIVVPCHRVIGSDNDLTGYTGGLWRKEWLLRHEDAIPKTLFEV